MNAVQYRIPQNDMIQALTELVDYWETGSWTTVILFGDLCDAVMVLGGERTA